MFACYINLLINFYLFRMVILKTMNCAIYTVNQKNCTLFVSSITLSNVYRLWFFHCCNCEVSVNKCGIESSTCFEHWSPVFYDSQCRSALNNDDVLFEHYFSSVPGVCLAENVVCSFCVIFSTRDIEDCVLVVERQHSSALRSYWRHEDTCRGTGCFEHWSPEQLRLWYLKSN